MLFAGIKEKSQSINCYLGSVARLLHSKSVLIEEQSLLETDNLLSIKCENVSDGIYSDIVEIVKSFLVQRHIKIIEMKINNIQELDFALSKYGMLMMNTDCRYLTYSKTFQNAFTKQSNHYVTVSGNIMNDSLSIFDSYIPETPISKFDGQLKIDPEDFEVAKFYFLDISKFQPFYNHDGIDLIKKMILFYTNCTKTGVYKRLITNIEIIMSSAVDVNKKKMFFYEMGTALSVSGTIVSRKIFSIVIKNNMTISNVLQEDINAIGKKYFTLRLLMLKCYVDMSLENINILINKVKVLEKEESMVYESILNEIREFNWNEEPL